MFPTRYSIGMVELARAVEERGFESLFVPEHTHIPTSRRSPWPGGADLPPEYRETLDPFLALTAAATVTERILLGTGICLAAEGDPWRAARAPSGRGSWAAGGAGRRCPSPSSAPVPTPTCSTTTPRPASTGCCSASRPSPPRKP